MSQINVKQNLKKLELARELIESAYQDLKNIREFREQGAEDHFLMYEIYSDTMTSLADLIQGARNLKDEKDRGEK